MGRVERMAEIIGLTPVDPVLSYREISKEDCGSYISKKIEYDVHGRKIPAYLSIPKGEGKFPAVLVNHQHHSQRHWGKSEVCGLVGDPFQAFASELAKRGFVTLAPDAICFEERRVNGVGTKENKEDEWNHFLALIHGIMTGETLAKIATEDAIGAISILNGLDCVNQEKIGCMGHSYGGNTTYFATAFDPRIRYALSSGSVVSYQHRMEHSTGIEFSSIIPGFLKEFEIVDIIKAIAPREFMIVCSDEDKYSKDAPSIYEQAKGNYRLMDAESMLQIKQFHGGHQLTQERYDFIMEWMLKHA